MRDPGSVLDSRLRLFSKIAGILAFLIGGLVLVGGWRFDIEAMRSFPSGSVSMKANTALGLAAAGLALWLLQEGAGRRRRFAGLALAALPALIGLLTLAEHGAGRGLGLDELLFRDADAVPPQIPGRPALNTAVALLLLGASFFTLDRGTRGRRYEADVLALGAGFIAVTGLLGHLADESVLVGLMPFNVMARHTAVAILLLSAGMLAARPGQGVTADLLGTDTPGGAPRTLLVAGLVAALGTLAAVAWLNWRVSLRAEKTAERVAHTQQVRYELSGLLSLLQDVEGGARGFVVTGDPAFLEPFTASVRTVNDRFRAVCDLIRDNPRQVTECAVLGPLITRRVDLSQANVDLRRNRGFEAAREAVAGGEGKAAMDQIRAVIGRMDRKELTLLDQLSASRRKEASNAMGLGLTATGLSVTLLIGLFALALRENRLRQRAQNETERFFTLSLDLLCIAGTDGYFKRVSPAFSQTLGHTTDELLARSFLEFVHPDDRDATLAEVEKLSRGVPTIEFENRYQCKDGSWKWLWWRTQPVASEGLLYATARDATERKRAEAEIRQLSGELQRRAAELEASNAELGAFSYSVSHDLRAPLRSIDGFSQILLEDHGDKLDAQGRAHLERVRAAAQRMGGLIDDLLMLSRITQGDLKRQPVDLSALVENVADELRRREPSRGVSFTIEPGLSAQADPRLLRIALDNLVGNAWKFTRDRPEARIAFGASREKGAPVYFVRDNGAGFDMAYADKLFAPFQRLHSPREFEGSGIGLAIVARVIHRHRGEIRTEAAVGQGATIHFTLGQDGAGTAKEEAKA